MTVIIKDEALSWQEAETLERWFRRLVRERKYELIRNTLEVIPEPMKTKYRAICNNEREKLKNGS